jgi:GT2 family glycosyltransferase
VFRDENWTVALGGSVINGLSGNACSTATHLMISYLYRYYNARSDSARFFTSNNFAVPANRFSSVGGFDPSFDFGEDREFCDRWLTRGYRMVYAADAVVFHSHALTFREFLRPHSNYGRGSHRYRAMLAQRNADHIQLEPLRFYLNLVRFPLSEQKKIGNFAWPCCWEFHRSQRLDWNQSWKNQGKN